MKPIQKSFEIIISYHPGDIWKWKAVVKSEGKLLLDKSADTRWGAKHRAKKFCRQYVKNIQPVIYTLDV